MSRIPLLLLSLLTLVGCSAGQPGDAVVIEGRTMGTYFRVTHLCQGVSKEAFSRELAAVNKELSNYDPNSELSQLNRQPLGSWLSVSIALPEILAASAELHDRSNAAFDVTVAPVLRLWGFGPGAKTIERAPSAENIAAAMARVNTAGVEWRAGESTAARRTADVEVDLSAIAKGHGVDRLAALLEAQACGNYLVDIGGEVRAQGPGRRGSGWRLGIEVPDPGLLGVVQRVLEVTTGGLATSGDYRNFVELADANGDLQRRPHAIDPRTGSPVSHRLTSVTVLAESTMWADGWATALLVLGPEAGFALAREQGLAALFLIRTPEGFEERYTEALKPFLR